MSLPRITAIERVDGSKRARRISIDGARFRTTSAAVIKALAIEVGDAVAPDDLAERCDRAERAVARERALRLLSYHDFSSAQIAARLENDGYPAHIVEETIEALIDSQLLDDARFAESVARARSRAGYGRRMIERDLARAGIAKPLIDEALASISGDQPLSAADAARRLARPADDVRRLAARLMRRGFEPDEAYDAATVVLGPEQEGCDSA